MPDLSGVEGKRRADARRSARGELVRAVLETSGGELAELAEPAEAGGRTLDVVLGAAKREVSVACRPRRTAVAVQRHPGAPRVEEVGTVRTGPPELLVAVPEDHSAVAYPREQALLVRFR